MKFKHHKCGDDAVNYEALPPPSDELMDKLTRMASA